MLVVGLIDIQHMQSVIKVFLFFLFFVFLNWYYFSDLETQWPRNPELKSRLCLSSTVIRGGKSQYWRKISLSSVSELGRKRNVFQRWQSHFSWFFWFFSRREMLFSRWFRKVKKKKKKKKKKSSSFLSSCSCNFSSFHFLFSTFPFSIFLLFCSIFSVFLASFFKVGLGHQKFPGQKSQGLGGTLHPRLTQSVVQ